MIERLAPDTNAVIALFASNPSVKAMLGAAPNVYALSVVLGELYYGARHSAQVEKNVEKVDAFAAANTVLEGDLETAGLYGVVKADLRMKGRMIPDNDIWIAALALQHDLTLATNDGHFRDVDGLKTVAW